MGDGRPTAAGVAYLQQNIKVIDAFLASKQHRKTHSVQLVMVTTEGVQRGAHSKDVNQQVTLDDLFR